MNKIANKQVICDVLLEESNKDKDIVVLCSDSEVQHHWHLLLKKEQNNL